MTGPEERRSSRHQPVRTQPRSNTHSEIQSAPPAQAAVACWPGYADGQQTVAALYELDPASPDYATTFVETLLEAAQTLGASDLHLQPFIDEIEIRWRMDGVLQPLGRFATSGSTDPITRLKVLADLLTYRRDVPQEGRIRERVRGVDIRVSTFPTLHGERAVVRLFALESEHQFLDNLAYPTEIADRLKRLLTCTAGALLITGPAGSGKSTTAYACLRQIVEESHGGRSVLTLEDPIEVAVAGVSQSQVNAAAGFTLTAGLRSLLRQDPEVILVGEVRDRETAGIAIQASLTGQLVVSTFHAGSAATAINRLSNMGIEPYMLRGGIVGVLAQRLVRRLCDCKQPVTDDADLLGLNATSAAKANGCAACNGTGYRGRFPIVELLAPTTTDLSAAILARSDAVQLEQIAIREGMTPLSQRAMHAIENHHTSPAEIRRTLGFNESH